MDKLPTTGPFAFGDQKTAAMRSENARKFTKNRIKQLPASIFPLAAHGNLIERKVAM